MYVCMYVVCICVCEYRWVQSKHWKLIKLHSTYLSELDRLQKEYQFMSKFSLDLGTHTHTHIHTHTYVHT
jgi:hypothetical protein